MNQSVLPYLVIIVVVIFSCISSSVGQNSHVGEDGYFYDSRYDYLGIDTILGNKRLVRNYVDCLLNLKPCTPEGKALKRILPEGLRTKCARCTPRQKQNALTVLRRLREMYPADWARLSAKWDPTGDFTKSFEKILETDDNNSIGKPVKTTRSPPPQTFKTTVAPPPPSPAILNRFSPAGEKGTEDQYQGNMGAPSEIKPTVQIFTTGRPSVTTTAQSTIRTSPYYVEISSTPKQPMKTRKPSVYTTTTFRSRPKPSTPATTTFYPDYKPVLFKPIYTGTMGLIDHFGNKIIRTTNLVTGILKNTVRVVAGRA